MLIGENIENGVYTYTPSVIAKDILINDGVQIRLSGTHGLRFILTLLMNRDGAENLFTDFGAVVIPTATAEGENTTLSTDRVGVVSKKDVRRRLPLFHPFRLVGFVYGMHHRNAACEIRPSFHRSTVCRLHRKRHRIYGLRRI